MRKLLRRFSNTKTKENINQNGIKREAIYARDFKFKSIGGFLFSDENTPRKIFSYLNNHVIGQTEAKRALAIAYSKRN